MDRKHEMKSDLHDDMLYFARCRVVLARVQDGIGQNEKKSWTRFPQFVYGVHRTKTVILDMFCVSGHFAYLWKSGER